MRAIILLFLMVCLTRAQPVPPSRLTFGGGWAREIDNQSFEKETAAGLGLSYGYRFHRHMEAEAGIFAALQPSPDICSAHGCYNPDDRFIWVPFGVRFYAPLSVKWMEISGGGGALYEKYSVSNPNTAIGLESRDGWGGYFVASAAVSIDHGRHWWLGASPRWFLANAGHARDRWFLIPLELSYHF